jgi:hypothetical protein
MTGNPRPYVAQALQVLKHGEYQAELRVTSDDEAASLLWAAQWLDEHREYSVTGMQLKFSEAADDDAHVTTTLIVMLDLANEPSPGKLGPWPRGVLSFPV